MWSRMSEWWTDELKDKAFTCHYTTQCDRINEIARKYKIIQNN